MAGMGCHPSRGIAPLRALTEAAQTRLTTISGSRDDLLVQRLPKDAYERAHARFHQALSAPGPRRRFSEVPTCEHDRFEDDIGFLVGRLRAVGCEQIVAIDLAKPELGVPVVRVVIPGLETLDEMPGYLPGPRARAARAEVLS